MHLLAIQQGLWVATLASQVLLTGALVRRNLARRYPFFVLYLAADALWGVILIQLDFKSVAYAYAYRIYMIMDCVLQLGVAAELYERICEHFIGIGKFRLYMAAFLLGLTTLLSLVSFRPDLTAQWGFPQTAAMWTERLETTVICGALILARLFLQNFMNVRAPMRPNVLFHWILLTCYFGVISLGMAALLLVHGALTAIYAVNITMLSGELACLLLWLRALTADGERMPEVYEWSAQGLARRQAITDGMLEFVERTRDQFLDRR